MSRLGDRIAGGIAATTVLLAAGLAGPWPSASADDTIVYDGAGPTEARLGILGDGTLAGIRWQDAYAPLNRYNYTFDGESCRRTIATSCLGRDGYAPENLLTTMERLSGQLGDVLVVVNGSNDPGTQFASAVDAVMAAAGRQGIGTVVWLTMATADVDAVGPDYASTSYTFRDNNRILLQKAAEYGGALQVADWATHSAAHPSWFGPDGVTLSAAGATAAATFIADTADAVLAGTTVTPELAPVAADAWIPIRRGDRGNRVGVVQNELIRIGTPLVGGADGVFGASTEVAVEQFQDSAGLAVTGIVDSVTLDSLTAAGQATEPEEPTDTVPSTEPPTTEPGGSGPASTPATTTTLPVSPGWTEIGPGDRGSAVAAVQRAAMSSGVYLRGGADGNYGDYTRTAVLTFQQRRGLPPSGVVDLATARALGLAPGATETPSPTPEWIDIGQGARDDIVRNIQEAIVGAGISLRGGVDGYFGPYTQDAVILFQSQHGIPATGIVDAETAEAMGLYDPSAAIPPAGPTTAAG